MLELDLEHLFTPMFIRRASSVAAFPEIHNGMIEVRFNGHACVYGVTGAALLQTAHRGARPQLYTVEVVAALEYPLCDDTNSVWIRAYAHKSGPQHDIDFFPVERPPKDRQISDFSGDHAVLHCPGKKVGNAN